MTNLSSKIVAMGDVGFKGRVTHLVDSMILRTETGQAIDFLIRSTNGLVLILQGDADDANADTVQPRDRIAQITFYPNTGTENAEVSLKVNNQTLKVRTIRQSPGFRPDEVLFHELVHAARLLGGEAHDDSLDSYGYIVKGLRHYARKLSMKDNDPLSVEEFFAVLVTNIYISEKGGSNEDLRYHYYALSRPMLEWEIKPYVFLFQYDADKEEDHFKLIEEFCGQHTTIAPMIAKAPAQFNPIRDYYSIPSTSNLVMELRTSDSDEPVRITQHEAYVPITDDYLIGLLEPATHAHDDWQYEKKLEQAFGSFTRIEALAMIVRLVGSTNAGDRAATLFNFRLASKTRTKLINVLRHRITQ